VPGGPWRRIELGMRLLTCRGRVKEGREDVKENRTVKLIDSTAHLTAEEFRAYVLLMEDMGGLDQHKLSSLKLLLYFPNQRGSVKIAYRRFEEMCLKMTIEVSEWDDHRISVYLRNGRFVVDFFSNLERNDAFETENSSNTQRTDPIGADVG
jgi:hypothetical protein